MPTYYFDPVDGNDANSGLTPELARRTPSITVAGDIGLIKRGTTWVAPAGTQAINIGHDNVTWGAYGDPSLPRPRIDCRNVSRGINVGTNIAGWTIRTIHLDNVASGTSRRGIINAVTGGVETVTVNGLVYDVLVTNVLTDGTNDCNGLHLTGTNIKVLFCEVDGVATDGIWLRARDCEVGWCRVRNVAQDDAIRGAFGDCIQFGGAGTNDFSGCYIHDNLLDHTSSSNVKNGFIVNAASATTSFRFVRNTVLCQTVPNQVAVYIDIPTAYVAHNRVVGGDFGIFISNTAGCPVVGNLVTDCNSGIRLGASTVGSSVVNNTVLRCGIGFFGTANDATTLVRNNLFGLCWTGANRHGNMSSNFNHFDRCGTPETYSNGSGSIGANSSTASALGLYDESDGRLLLPPSSTPLSAATDNPLAGAGDAAALRTLLGGRPLPGLVPIGWSLPAFRRPPRA